MLVPSHVGLAGNLLADNGHCYKSCSTPTSVYLDCSSFGLQLTPTYSCTKTVPSKLKF